MNEPKSNLPRKEQGELLIIGGGPEVGEAHIFERCIYFPMFYCLCYVKDISPDVLEEQVSEEISGHK